MRKLMSAAVLGALAVFVLVPAVGNAASTTLTAKLSGKSEVPKGDPNGSGTATIKIDPAKKTACFTIKLKNIEPTSAGHIHKGKKGVAGPIVIPLFAGTAKHSGCVKASKSLLSKILKSPASYYVNVHNAKYPGGALRGQL